MIYSSSRNQLKRQTPELSITAELFSSRSNPLISLLKTAPLILQSCPLTPFAAVSSAS